MDYQNDFKKWEKSTNVLSLEKVKLPTEPVDEFAAKAETLAIEATKDKEELVLSGLDYTLVEDLPSLAGNLRYCEAQWMSEYRARQEAQKEWLEQSPEAYDLRDEMLHHFTYAFRKHSDIIKKVRRIREGGGHTDMIQDLLELSVLAEKYPQPLVKINYDVNLNSKSKTKSHAMANLLAEANGSTSEISESKLLRDKAFTLLYNRMMEIRECGRYVFWRNEDRKKCYLSN